DLACDLLRFESKQLFLDRVFKRGARVSPTWVLLTAHDVSRTRDHRQGNDADDPPAIFAQWVWRVDGRCHATTGTIRISACLLSGFRLWCVARAAERKRNILSRLGILRYVHKHAHLLAFLLKARRTGRLQLHRFGNAYRVIFGSA